MGNLARFQVARLVAQRFTFDRYGARGEQCVNPADCNFHSPAARGTRVCVCFYIEDDY